VGASTERRFIEKCYVTCIYIEISFYRVCWRFIQVSSWNITKRCSDCWIYRDTSVKMRFRAAHLIATKFTSIKSTRVTVKIYCRAKRRVSSHLAARMILLIIIAISVLLIAIIDCIMLSTPPMTRRLTLPEAWPICEA